MRRVSIRAILSDPVERKALFVRFIRSAQAMEGVDTTEEQAAHAYDVVQAEKRIGFYMEPVRNRAWYVSNLPGYDGGRDWEYAFDVSKALLLSRYWQRRFVADCRRCKRTAVFV